MRRSKVHQLQADIEQVRSDIEQWRRGGRRGQSMPAELWSAAAELAARYGVYPVSRRLGVGYGKLKVLLGQSRLPRVSDAEAAGFVELCASELFGAPAVTGSVVVEVLGADGSRLLVSSSGPGALDIPAVVSAFLSGGERCCR